MPAVACYVDTSAAVYGGAGALSLPAPEINFSGVPPTTNSTTVNQPPPPQQQWSPSLSAELYRIDRWGPPYFAVNSSGNVTVKPFGDATLPHQEIDLLKVVKKVSDPKSSSGLGLHLPVIIRFPDVLKHRLESLQSAFDFAVRTHGYGSHYQGVYPVKCNQDRYIVEDIVEFGSGFRFGLEAGSKPELLMALSSLCKGSPDSLLVCNGFKDAEYISLAIIGRKLGLNTVIVIEQEEEVDMAIELSRKMGIRPVVGVRAKLRTKHSGHFGSTSGEKGKFGLTTTQILRVVRKLENFGMLDCLQLLHFHIGSQIPTTALLSDAVAEASQVYCELTRLGAHMRVIDIGGGLGIDYDGSKSGDSDLSVGYTLEEYASAVVGTVKSVCDRKGVKSPVICSESGRAIVSHHSILVFEAVSSSSSASPPMPGSTLALDYLVDGLTDEVKGEYRSLTAAAMRGEYESCLMYSGMLKQRCVELFKDGCLGMEQLAAVDGLCELVSKALGVADGVCTYNVNLSVFTSIPDFWGIGQLFPIMPIHRLDQQPKARGILSDLTCDSDGKIDKFIGDESSLPLHELSGGEGYYLGMFLGGAYEEALGGVHNLFGGPSVVRVQQSDGPQSYAVTRAVPGPSSSDVLRVMHHEPELMFQNLKHRAEECDNDYTAGPLADMLAQSFNSTPYLVPGPATGSCGFSNGSGLVNGCREYFYGVDDGCNAAAVDTAAGEEEQWSYVCA